MKPSCFCLVALLSAAPVVAIDFTPMQGRTIEDGAPMTRVFFRDGNKRIFFSPPKGWRMAGGGNDITFHPATAPVDGMIRLGNSPVDAATPLDDSGKESYAAAAREALPKHAEAVEVLADCFDAYPLDDWKSYEVRFAYELHGTENLCSVLFIRMSADRRICFVVDARKRDFGAVESAARDLLGSWFEPLLPGWSPQHAAR